MDYRITHLKQLESEAIFVLRETASQFEKPVLLFSGAKIQLSWLILRKRLFGREASISINACGYWS